MGSKAVGWAMEQQGLGIMEKFVLVALAERANREGLCWPTRRTIAADLGITPEPHPGTITRALATLEERGCILRFAMMRSGEQIGGCYLLAIPERAAADEDALLALLSENGLRLTSLEAVNPGALMRGGVYAPALIPPLSASAQGVYAPARRGISASAYPEENLKENLKTRPSKEGHRSRDLADVQELHPDGSVPSARRYGPGAAGVEIVRRIAAELAKGKRSWNLPKIAAETWDVIEERDGAQGCIRLLADYCVIHDVPEEALSFPRLGVLYKRWGKYALLGLDVALAKGKEGDGLYNYAEAVCKGKKNGK